MILIISGTVLIVITEALEGKPATGVTIPRETTRSWGISAGRKIESPVQEIKSALQSDLLQKNKSLLVQTLREKIAVNLEGLTSLPKKLEQSNVGIVLVDGEAYRFEFTEEKLNRDFSQSDVPMENLVSSALRDALGSQSSGISTSAQLIETLTPDPEVRKVTELIKSGLERMIDIFNSTINPRNQEPYPAI